MDESRYREILHQAISQHFGAMAKDLGLSLRLVRDGMYEVVAPVFTQRIYRGIGHRRDFLVTLIRTAGRPTDLDPTGNEIGLGVFAEFTGERFNEIDLFTEDDVFRAVKECAAAAKRLFTPYLLGQRDDFEDVKQYVGKQIEEELARLRGVRYPSNVQKRWHLPPEPKAD